MVFSKRIGIIILFLFVVIMAGNKSEINAQANLEQPKREARTTLYSRNHKIANENVVGIITGSVSGTYIRIGADLADVLNSDDMRVLTIMGRGSIQNLKDILYLRGIDIGIIQSDAMNYFIENNIYPNVKDKIHYIAKLYNEEAHILARSDIYSIEDLQGKRVNFGKIGSGTFVTAKTVFSGLNINARVTNYDQRKALDLLKRGELAAMMFVAGKPASNLKSIPGKHNFKLLDVPYTNKLQRTYLPSSFTDKDYPNLVPQGKEVKTVATGAVMAVYNWKNDAVRFQRVKRFIERFFSQINRFADPSRHPKWKELFLTANVPGWRRYSVADNMLKKLKLQNRSQNNIGARFRAFLQTKPIHSSQLDAQQRQELFQDFLEWSGQNN
ncbi:MAG: TAXI family TRAP transporter solute-binding subunit [Pseudomonadota bacterium]